MHKELRELARVAASSRVRSVLMGQRAGKPRRKAPLTHDPDSLVWARKAAGRTQVWLAEQLGISAGHMSEIESGTRGLTAAKLRKTAELLDCPEAVLLAKATAA